jgi:hypothetical protein
MPYIPENKRGSIVPDKQYWDDSAEEMVDCIENCSLSYNEALEYVKSFLENIKEDCGDNVATLTSDVIEQSAATLTHKILGN